MIAPGSSDLRLPDSFIFRQFGANLKSILSMPGISNDDVRICLSSALR
jgi:hypothetical protein